MSLGVFALQVVRVVGGRDRQPQLCGEAEHPVRDDLLLGKSVILDFEPETVGSERARKPGRARLRRFVVALPEIQRDLTREAGGQRNNAFAMALQHLFIDPWPAVIALEKSDRRQLDQVLITDAVLGEQHQVRVVGTERRVGAGSAASARLRLVSDRLGVDAQASPGDGAPRARQAQRPC